MNIKRSLFSVYDKTGLVDLARPLAARGVELVASGGYICLLKVGDKIVSRHKIAVIK